ncbi:MAG: type II 3-dehydroquinate dehydratase [Archangiaceae bacterium]|nr:type II 3-dehydroquinate dehydratase [Archangiaceae bacterium]
MPSRVLLLHGPNLNLLFDLAELDAELEQRARKLGIDLKTFQANSEGALVDALHAERTKVSGVIVNAAKLAPTAAVLAEALLLVKRPAIEVVTDKKSKARSALEGAVLETVRGEDAYVDALEAMALELRADQGRATGMNIPVVDDDVTGELPKDEVVKKSLGRKTAGRPVPANAGGGKKTLGRAVEGNTAKVDAESVGLTRAMVREKIAERLSGKLTSAGLSTWARDKWQSLQRGAPCESGHRDKLEDVLQTLVVSAAAKANDHQLIELMTQL